MMKWATFNRPDGQTGFGPLTADRVCDLTGPAAAQGIRDLLDLVRHFPDLPIEDWQAAGESFDLAAVSLQAPFPRALRNVICLGKNYKEHVNEIKSLIDMPMDKPDYPIYFSKMISRFTGPQDPVHISGGATAEADYEVELALIIGKEGKDIAPEAAWDHIFGYTVGNDYSARDLQTAHRQWFHGKSLDGFCALGPVIVSRDDLPTPPALAIESFVNGDRRQHGRTDELIFDIPSILADFSRGTTLLPGDIILTGTPAGVGAGFDPPKFLQPGDEVISRIEGIGELRNTMV
ncbi:fumarylacetoacetate hydrolase family protein [Peptococcus simiae]|uniref:Fumarylacetoacetate hydrolase family protein n=1 Tax=Peptococcus simiae TaxID=1643805 RepID=A0ABW9GVM8_9FIRM